jgi:hypothetical protein
MNLLRLCLSALVRLRIDARSGGPRSRTYRLISVSTSVATAAAAAEAEVVEAEVAEAGGARAPEVETELPRSPLSALVAESVRSITTMPLELGISAGEAEATGAAEAAEAEAAEVEDGAEVEAAEVEAAEEDDVEDDAAELEVEGAGGTVAGPAAMVEVLLLFGRPEGMSITSVGCWLGRERIGVRRGGRALDAADVDTAAAVVAVVEVAVG